MVPIMSACAIFACVLGTQPTAEATTLVRFGLNELVEYSGLIVEGTATRITTTPSSAERPTTTTYEVCDLEIVVGTHDWSCIELEVLGGQDVDGVITGWSGTPELRVGSRYLLFLLDRQEYDSPFVGWWQGVFRLVDSSKGPSLLSSSGYPVKGIENGAVVTRRNVGFLPQPGGMLQTVSDEDFVPVDPRIVVDEAMSRDDFVNAIHMTTSARKKKKKSVPSGLPSKWGFRSPRDIEEGESTPPPLPQEVMP